MTDTERLVEFVLAQIADDEAAARAVAWGPHWTFRPQRVLEVPPAVTTDDGRSVLGGAESAAQHAARHDPAQVLADCAAKRAIVELCVTEIDNDTDGAATALSVLYWLAQPYADRKVET